MPGHKGRAPDGSKFLAPIYPYDITELDCTDNLYAPAQNGAVEQSERLAAELFHTAHTVFSAGGATAALFAAIILCCEGRREPRILCDRRAHRSVINAFAVCGVSPIWFDPHDTPKFADIAKPLGADEIAAVLITSPDYYGRMCDVAAVSRLAVSLGAPLICDNSHGSHLAFINGGEYHPYKLGARLCVDSIHKTLPALTGAALLHFSDDFSPSDVRRAMSRCASTSPSYIIAASADAALRYMKLHGADGCEKLAGLITDAKQTLHTMGFSTAQFPIGDPQRICIRDKNARALYAHLEKHGVVGEFCDSDDVVLIASVMNTKEDFDRLCAACADFSPSPSPGIPDFYPSVLPERVTSIREAVFARSRDVKTEESIGLICAESVTPYPPGVPLIVAGER
ncbi:MAG: hypothetical protein WCQ72_07845, partial [Eubacteriales bacterium]